MDKNDKILNTLIDAIKKRLKFCLFNLVNDTTLDDENDISLKAELAKLKKEVFDIFTGLPSLLSSQDTDRKSEIKKLSKLKEKVLETGLIYYPCMDTVCTVQNIVMRELMERDGGEMFSDSDELASPEEILELMEDVYDHAISEEDEAAYFRQMLAALPCRMSKGKFAEYAEKSLRECPVSYIDNFYLRENLYPFSVSSGREALPEMYELPDRVLGEKLNLLSNEELNDINSGLDEKTDEIFFYTDCISMLYSDINYMLALLTYAFDTDFVTDGDMVLKDIFYSAAELCKKESLDEIDKELRKQTNEKSEDVMDNIDNNISEAVEAVTKYFKSLKNKNEADSSIVSAAAVLKEANELYSAEAYDEACRPGREKYYKSNEEISAAETAKIFASEFEAAMADFPPIIKKALRKEAFSLLPCPYSYDEFEDYVSSVLEQYYQTPGYKKVIGGLSIVLNTYGREYFEQLHGHEHHHHDHNCDCGCDHHHHSHHL
ncbi:MAG: hypothetical protein LUG24_06535 [Clostridiales bacterium]|nr:hypothetical protein [Clostridiales bacterium]